MEQLTDGAMTERLERTKRVVLRSMEPEISYTAEGLGVESSVLISLCRDGKIRKSGGRGHYVLAEDVAVEEQPDEVVPVPPEEEEEEEELEEPFDAKAAEAGAKMWVLAAKNGSGVMEVDATRCVSRYQAPQKGFPVVLRRLTGGPKLALVKKHPVVGRILKAIKTAVGPHKMTRTVTHDDLYKSYGASAIYFTVGLDKDGRLIAVYIGQKRFNLLRLSMGNYCGSFRFLVARQKLLDAHTLVVFAVLTVDHDKASLAEALGFGAMFGEARALGLVDDIIVQGPPIGAPAQLLSKPVARAIERLPADHALRDMLRKLKEDPGYVRQLSEPTREARSAVGKKVWKDMAPKKKKKRVESCV